MHILRVDAFRALFPRRAGSAGDIGKGEPTAVLVMII